MSYTHHGMLFDLKEGSPVLCSKLDEPEVDRPNDFARMWCLERQRAEVTSKGRDIGNTIQDLNKHMKKNESHWLEEKCAAKYEESLSPLSECRSLKKQ